MQKDRVGDTPESFERKYPGLIGGVEKRDITLVPYDADWPQKFVVHRTTISQALGRKALRIEHIGSTAIPGLHAKPIIDINLTVADTEHEEDYLPDLLAAGYVLRVHEIGHKMVRTPQLDVHLHICNPGSDWERRHLLFRDWLRYNSADRQKYAECKQELASRDWPDMQAYADKKSPVIQEIMRQAEDWAQQYDWDKSYQASVAKYDLR